MQSCLECELESIFYEKKGLRYKSPAIFIINFSNVPKPYTHLVIT